MKSFPLALAASLWGCLVSAQSNYSNIPVSFLQSSSPSTPLPQGKPWGIKTCNNTNTYTDPPHTGVIRSYDFTVKRGRKAPDGYMRDVLLVNDQFPGPLIEANWGDTIQVTVHNEIEGPVDGTAMHWHGLLQKESQWMDGVPGIQQCPIPPGGSFTYSFLADLYGTTWYHAHYSAQYAGGVFGPLVIHGPDTLSYDIDIGPVILTDYFHKDYFSIVEQIETTNVNNAIVLSDNNLINGRNNFNCSTVAAGDDTPCISNAGLSSFQFTPGKMHRLRLINAGAEGMQKFTLDGHNMTVIANDFVPIEPYDTQVVTLGVGQRTDVLIKAPEKPLAAYTMRSSLTLTCSLATQPDATAIVTYGHYDESKGAPNTTPWPAWTASLTVCKNDDLSLTVPVYPITPDPAPPVTQEIAINFGQNSTGFWVWTMNNVSFRANYNNPILLLSNLGNNSYPDDPDWNVYNFGANSSVRFILNNPTGASHPIHLHGHNMFVLSVGTGSWDGSIVNPENPQRRDVQLLPAGGYLVLQMTSDNPGAWPLHCHIAWHVSTGLYVTVLERPDDIAKLNIPSIMAQTCRDWATFTNGTVADQIDSGL